MVRKSYLHPGPNLKRKYFEDTLLYLQQIEIPVPSKEENVENTKPKMKNENIYKYVSAYINKRVLSYALFPYPFSSIV